MIISRSILKTKIQILLLILNRVSALLLLFQGLREAEGENVIATIIEANPNSRFRLRHNFISVRLHLFWHPDRPVEKKGMWQRFLRPILIFDSDYDTVSFLYGSIFIGTRAGPLPGPCSSTRRTANGSSGRSSSCRS